MTDENGRRPGDAKDYEYIINHSPAVIFSWRRAPGWPVDFVSENVRLFGYEPEEFLSGALTYAQIIHPGDLSRLMDEIRVFVSQGRTEWTQEYRILNKSGEVRWVSDRTFAPRDPAGVVTHLQGVILDITTAKAAEAALQASEAKLRGIIEHSGDGIVVTDERGNIIEWNGAQERISGRPRSEVIGRSLWEVQIEAALEGARQVPSVEFLRDALMEILRTGQGAWLNRTLEQQMRRADGETIVMETVAVAIPTGRGFLLASVNRDVTEKRRAQEALQTSLAEKEILLKEINHRVKNNMQVLSSLLNFQSSFVKDPAALRMLQESRDRIRTMALIHEKLYKSADLSHIDFSEYLRNLVSMLVDSYAVGPGCVELDLDIHDTFLSLNAGIPCGLIVNELVSNALKHAFPGGRSGRIRVELKPLDPPKFKLVICDDGAGFPEGVDFRNAPSLGLQVVTMLVAQLRGTIELHRDRGTCFVIVFEDAPTRRRP